MLLIVDRPSEKEQVQMLMGSLQLIYERPIAAMKIIDFTSLKNALFRFRDAIARDLWCDSHSPSSADRKGKRPAMRVVSDIYQYIRLRTCPLPHLFILVYH